MYCSQILHTKAPKIDFGRRDARMAKDLGEIIDIPAGSKIV